MVAIDSESGGFAENIENTINTGGFNFTTALGTLLAHSFLELASSPQAVYDPHFRGPPLRRQPLSSPAIPWTWAGGWWFLQTGLSLRIAHDGAFAVFTPPSVRHTHQAKD
jgi:hypothetical protein